MWWKLRPPIINLFNLMNVSPPKSWWEMFFSCRHWFQSLLGIVFNKTCGQHICNQLVLCHWRAYDIYRYWLFQTETPAAINRNQKSIELQRCSYPLPWVAIHRAVIISHATIPTQLTPSAHGAPHLLFCSKLWPHQHPLGTVGVEMKVPTPSSHEHFLAACRTPRNFVSVLIWNIRCAIWVFPLGGEMVWSPDAGILLNFASCETKNTESVRNTVGGSPI